MICFIQEHEELLRTIQAVQVSNGAMQATIDLLQEALGQVRSDKDSQIAKLEAQVQELRKEQLRVTDDVLISMGIRQTPASEPAPHARGVASTELSQSAKIEDRLDDALAGLSPSDWQEIAERQEWEAYNADQKLELEAFIARRQQQLAQKDAQKNQPKGGQENAASLETPASSAPQ